MPPSSGQIGRIFENLIEDAYTEQSGGALVTYLPLLDSRGVDRAISIAGTGPPLFLQIKGRSARAHARVTLQLPLSGVGNFPTWVIAVATATADNLTDCYLIPGPDLLAHGTRGHLIKGGTSVRATLSPTSPTWARYHVTGERIGGRLLDLIGAPGLNAAPPIPSERQQEEGGFFETAVAAALLGGDDRLALYRPAVDVGRDLLVQVGGSPSSIYVQIKGTERLDGADLVRFQIRRRTFSPDPSLAYLFCTRVEGQLGPLWLVPAPELAERAAGGDADHISFEAHLTTADPRWAHRRLDPIDLPAAISAAASRSAQP